MNRYFEVYNDLQETLTRIHENKLSNTLEKKYEVEYDETLNIEQLEQFVDIWIFNNSIDCVDEFKIKIKDGYIDIYIKEYDNKPDYIDRSE